MSPLTYAGHVGTVTDMTACMSQISTYQQPQQHVTTAPTSVIPLHATMPPQGMMGYPQQQGILGSVTQTQYDGMTGAMSNTGKVGLWSG